MAKEKEKRSEISWSLCQCEVNGLVRPTNGPIRIKSTDVLDKDVLKARLSGPHGATAHAVKVAGKFFYVGPGRGEKKHIRPVPADSLTDALHGGLFMVNEELKEQKALSHKKRPMPHVSVRKVNKAAKRKH